MWAALAVSTVLAAAPADAGTLQLKNDRFTYGLYGAERKDSQVIPGDVLWVAFDVEGLTVKEDGKVAYSTSMQLLDKDGKTVFEERPVDRDTVNMLGGSHLPCWSQINIGADTAPGDYTVKISVSDRAVAKAEPVAVSRKFTVVPAKLGLIQCAFGYDKPATAPPPAPPVAVPGQTLLVYGIVVGFDSKAGAKPTDLPQIDVIVEMSVLDDAGKPTLAKPFPIEAKEPPPDSKTIVPFMFPVLLNRPGKFTVVLTATDKQGNKPPVTQKLDLTVVDVK